MNTLMVLAVALALLGLALFICCCLMSCLFNKQDEQNGAAEEYLKTEATYAKLLDE